MLVSEPTFSTPQSTRPLSQLLCNKMAISFRLKKTKTKHLAWYDNKQN